MKQIKFLMMAIAVLMSMSLTSCMNSESSDPVGQGVVQVMGYGAISFKTTDGLELIPSPTSLATVKTNNKFDPNNTDVAFIAYTYDLDSPDNVNYLTNKKLYIELTFAVSVEGKLVSTVEGSSSDSISTAPVIGLEKLTTTDELIVMNGSYLLTGINYYIDKYAHHLTLVHYDAEDTDDEIKLYLRHTGTPETTTTYSSKAVVSMYPSLYFYAFDLRYILSEFSGKSSVKITVEVEENPYSSKLVDSSTTTKTYSIDYKFN